MSTRCCTINSLPLSLDIFCRVIDNFGDAGVLWRLAREMRCEGFAVRLIIDDVPTLALLAGKPRDTAPEAIADDERLQVIHWDNSWNNGPCPLTVADMVVEGFACRLPPDYENRIIAHKTVWVNIDYFTAEDWIEGCHMLKSILPTTGAEKINYFPGVTPASGGLTIEKEYEKARQAFLGQQPVSESLRVFYFSYPSAPVSEFASLLINSRQKIDLSCSACEAGRDLAQVIERTTDHEIRVKQLDFVAQTDFDELLWGSDIAFIRGEDSAARAMLAGIVFIWQIYPQDDGAHWVKLTALTEKMKPMFDCQQAFEAWERFQRSFNAGKIDSEAWLAMLEQFSALKIGFARWGEHVRGNANIAQRLSQMIQKR